jgi:hypothetical protein
MPEAGAGAWPPNNDPVVVVGLALAPPPNSEPLEVAAPPPPKRDPVGLAAEAGLLYDVEPNSPAPDG